MFQLDQVTQSAVSTVGELLIRACAVIGTLTHEQQMALQQATDGGLPDCIAMALDSARRISPEVQQSLVTHPPEGMLPAGSGSTHLAVTTPSTSSVSDGEDLKQITATLTLQVPTGMSQADIEDGLLLMVKAGSTAASEAFERPEMAENAENAILIEVHKIEVHNPA